MRKQIFSAKEIQKELCIKMNVDVLVVGGGPAGIIAAQAAADNNLKVALIESRSFLGGNMTIGIPVLGFLGQKKNQIIKGLPQKFIDRLAEHNAASEHHPCPLHMSATFIEPDAVKLVALEMLRESGVDVLLYTFCTGVIMDEEYLRGVIIESKAGREAIFSKIVIDCTGDADIAFCSGVPCEKGDEMGRMQPPTLMFSVENVNIDKLRLSIVSQPQCYSTDFIPHEYFGLNHQFILVGLRNLIRKARANGLDLPTDRTIIITGLRKSEAWINMTRVNGIDGTDPESLTKGEFIARKQMENIINYLINYVPGFENSSLSRIAPFLGIRETRRITGKYVMTRDDIISCKRFSDSIAVASYPLDIHHPIGGDCTLEWCGDCYDIPYRSLIPLKVENLLIAGRSISATHEAMSSIRVMATCMALGEAAGRAAKMAIFDDLSPSQININKLRDELLKEGVYLRS